MLLRLKVVFLAITHRNILWLLDVDVTTKLCERVPIIYVWTHIVLN